MNKLALHNQRSLQNSRRLIRRHRFQIVNQPQFPEFANVFAMVFRPGMGSGSFKDGVLRKIGTTVTIVASYEPKSRYPSRFDIPVRGIRAAANPDGSVQYGNDGCLFLHNGAAVPRLRPAGAAINVSHNPSLVETVLRLDKACKALFHRIESLPILPQFPRILLGFAPSEPPKFVDSVALRRITARRLGVSPDRLGANGSVLLDRLLRDTWQHELLHPESLGNTTGLVLINAELCSQARGCLEIYEDFIDLIGFMTWNPARKVDFPRLPNPARSVLAQHDIDIYQNFDQPLSDGLVAQLERSMRNAIGARQSEFTREELFDAITNPDLPLVGYVNRLPCMRSLLPAWISECTTDNDLLKGMHDPLGPLFVSCGSKVQVVRKRELSSEAVFRFASSDLDRRIEANLDVGEWNVNSRRRAVTMS